MGGISVRRRAARGACLGLVFGLRQCDHKDDVRREERCRDTGDSLCISPLVPEEEWHAKASTGAGQEHGPQKRHR
jgi:hypothetical protein